MALPFSIEAPEPEDLPYRFTMSPTGEVFIIGLSPAGLGVAMVFRDLSSFAVFVDEADEARIAFSPKPVQEAEGILEKKSEPKRDNPSGT